jgi:F0F1-type ATP synthase membrane subunit b/b'
MTYAIIAIVILALLGYLVRQYNLPKILAERNESIEAKAKAADERRNDQLDKQKLRQEAREKRRAEIAARRKRP